MSVMFGTDKIRKNIMIGDRRTSFALESGIWDALVEMCRSLETSVDDLCQTIVAQSDGTSMSSSIRLAILSHFRERVRE
jgi:predicted DNA-binding ribbon-helix-helix protein